MRVLIAAGGTAGHINPALAIAGAIKKADPTAEIHFAGRKEGMEYRLVTQAGYPFHHIEITGFQRKLSLNNIKRNIITLWNLALSGPKAKKMMKDIQPDLVIGCGGYVSGPVVRCAARQGIKTALHEQNAFPGVTNKLLAPDVDIVFAAVPAAVEKLGAPEKTIVVGLGGALCVWGGINLLEGYGQDNPGSKSQGVKQLVAGGGVALIGVTLVPLLSGLLG